MIKLCLGIPAYGVQLHQWWNPLVAEAAALHSQGIELVAPIAIGGMKADTARNAIVEEFLKTSAEWLQWVDADNPPPTGMIQRLLRTHRTLVTGIYVKRGDTPEPIFYLSNKDGMYQTVEDWTPGEILPIDSAGMGGCLCHRSVFEDIEKNYRVLERTSGGITVVHKDAIQGDVFDETADTDGQVIAGVLQDRLRLPKHKHRFPFFLLEYGRTEDYPFFEMAKRAGHQLWADTSVEIAHLGVKSNKPADWLQLQRQI